MAGLAGGMFAIYYGPVGPPDFRLTVGLPYLLLLVVGGVSAVGGAAFGGLSLISLSWLQSAFPTSAVLTWLQNIGPGLAGIGIGQNPNGAWEVNVEAVERRWDRLRRPRRTPETPATPPGTPPLPQPRHAADPPAP